MVRKNILLMMAAVGVMMSGCINEEIEGADLKVGDELPEFEVMMSDGTVVSDDDLRGSVSVVMFFHTSCPDCQRVLPVMQDIYNEYTSKGVKFALISREENGSSIFIYWIKNGLGMPYSAQNDRSVYKKFAKNLIPRIYISDRDGIIRTIFTDNPVPDYDDLNQSLKNLIN